jgi:hypothetical protein
MPGSAETAALARVPDLAQSVDTRGMLLSGFAHVRFNEPANHVTDGFVVILPPRALVSAVGRPTATLLLTAAQDLSHADVLCRMASELRDSAWTARDDAVGTHP